jgi:transposase
MRPEGTQDELERRRHRAIEMLDEGKTTSEIAARLDVDPRSVRRWRTMYRRRGEVGIRAKPVPGRPPKLTKQQRNGLRRRLLKGARANGFPTDLWTCRRVAELIERCYGVEYHVDHIGRLLAALGFSCQKPTKRAHERDESAIQQWVAKDWPRIKKKRSSARPSRLHR